jgi:hypothetical protein
MKRLRRIMLNIVQDSRHASRGSTRNPSKYELKRVADRVVGLFCRPADSEPFFSDYSFSSMIDGEFYSVHNTKIVSLNASY